MVAVGLDARLRGHDEKNTQTLQLTMNYGLSAMIGGAKCPPINAINLINK